MNILIDSREKDRKDRANLFYSGKGHNAYITTLDVGDYLFDDKVVFEYKEISDFMSSIVNESLFNEATNQALRYPFHYVIVVGDVKQYCDDSWIYLKRKWRNDYPKFLSTYYGRYYGALRRLRTFTTPIVCKNEKNAFFEMLLQAIKCLDGKSKYYSNVTRQVDCQDAVDVLLTSAKNISVKKAEAIRKHHTINNVYDLLNLTVNDFKLIDGIGDKTANNVYEFIHKGEEQ
jgi:ERCC4-type nuclease